MDSPVWDFIENGEEILAPFSLVASGQASALDQRAERQRLLAEVRSQGHSNLYIVIDTQTNRLQLRRERMCYFESGMCHGQWSNT